MFGKSHINRLALTVIFLLGLVALSAGLYVSQHLHMKKKIDVSQFHGTLLNTPRVIEEFSLTGTDHKPFNNASLRGSWTMVFFGFTHCGYMCPTTMAELGKMYRLLEEKHIKPLPRVVMISVDPSRDHLDKLGHYVKAFDSHFYGARGKEDKIRAMTRELGIAYMKIARKDAGDFEDYDMEHTGSIILFNPQGELAAFFTSPHKAGLLAKDYMLLIA
jgi:protein SCO1/2